MTTHTDDLSPMTLEATLKPVDVELERAHERGDLRAVEKLTVLRAQYIADHKGEGK